MKIVIDIPEEVKTKIDENLNACDLDIYDCVVVAVKNGTPLPKGHGRLIDGDKLANDDRVCEGYSCTECPFEIFRHHSCRLMNFIKDYPTIIARDGE